jgi:hypothetical protein
MRARLAKPGLPLLVVAVLVAAAVAFPLGVIASHQFTDVPTSNTFHDDIDAIRDAGVTTGCALNLYCPKDFVTREQMAAFLNRLGALEAGTTPVVNAASAQDSERLDGLDSSDFLAAGNIEIHQQAPWQEYQTTVLTLRPDLAWTNVDLNSSGNATIQLEVQAPGTIGEQQYGLHYVEICYGAAFDVTITSTAASYGSFGGATIVIEDFTDRAMTTGACYDAVAGATVAPGGAITLRLDLSWVDTTVAKIGRVTSHWVAL